jgi:hypothetical protein
VALAATLPLRPLRSGAWAPQWHRLPGDARLGFLWRFGYREAWAKVERLVAGWCTRDDTSFQASAVHLCADVAGLHVDELRVADFVHRGTVARWDQEDAEVLDLVEGTASGSSGN